MPEPKRRRRAPAISLRVLLALVVVLALVLGWLTNRARNQESVVRELLQRGFRVQFDYGYPALDAQGHPLPHVQSLGPSWMRWLRRHVGDDYFRKPVSIESSVSPYSLGRANFSGRVPDKVDDALIRRISSLDGVRKLDFASIGIGDDGFAAIARMRELESLSLANCVLFSDASLVYLSYLPNLKRLSIARGDLSIDGFLGLGQVRQLERLDLTGNYSGAGLVHLGHLKHLRSLSLWFRSLDDAGLTHLHALPQLEQLSIRSFGITDAGLASIARLPHLTTLWIQNGHITDNGIAALAPLHALRSLQITPSEGPLSDEALVSLKQFPKLERLSLGHRDARVTQFSAEGLTDLVQSLPALRLLFLEPDLLTPELAEQLRAKRPGLTIQTVH